MQTLPDPAEVGLPNTARASVPRTAPSRTRRALVPAVPRRRRCGGGAGGDAEIARAIERPRAAGVEQDDRVARLQLQNMIVGQGLARRIGARPKGRTSAPPAPPRRRRCEARSAALAAISNRRAISFLLELERAPRPRLPQAAGKSRQAPHHYPGLSKFARLRRGRNDRRRSKAFHKPCQARREAWDRCRAPVPRPRSASRGPTGRSGPSAGRSRAAALASRFVADQRHGLQIFVGAFQPRGAVHRVAKRGVADAALAAEIADHASP